MSDHVDELDTISKQIQHLDGKLRRKTIWLALIPILLGLAVFVVAWFTVDSARQSVDAAERDLDIANSAVEDAVAEKRRLDRETAELRRSKSRLDEEVAAREALLRRIEATLPETEQREVEVIQQGLGYGKRGAYTRAIEEYESALELNPENSLTHNLLGYAYYQQREFDRAISCYERSIDLDRDFADPYFNLAASLWAIGEEDAAVEALATAFELNPRLRSRAHRDPAYAPIRAHLEVTSGKRTGRTDEEQNLINRGVSAAQKGDLEGALEAYGQALEINNDNASVYNWQGYARFRLGLFGEAIESLTTAVRLDPENAEHHYNLAVALCAAGKVGAATEEMAVAFELDPEFEMLAMQDPNTECVREAMGQSLAR